MSLSTRFLTLGHIGSKLGRSAASIRLVSGSQKSTAQGTENPPFEPKGLDMNVGYYGRLNEEMNQDDKIRSRTMKGDRDPMFNSAEDTREQLADAGTTLKENLGDIEGQVEEKFAKTKDVLYSHIGEKINVQDINVFKKKKKTSATRNTNKK